MPVLQPIVNPSARTTRSARSDRSERPSERTASPEGPVCQLLLPLRARAIRVASTVFSTAVRRRFRLRLLERRVAKWLVPALRCLTLPLAVRRKRFLVPLWVFCFGMIGGTLYRGWSKTYRTHIIRCRADRERGTERKPCLAGEKRLQAPPKDRAAPGPRGGETAQTSTRRQRGRQDRRKRHTTTSPRFGWVASLASAYKTPTTLCSYGAAIWATGYTRCDAPVGWAALRLGRHLPVGQGPRSSPDGPLPCAPVLCRGIRPTREPCPCGPRTPEPG